MRLHLRGRAFGDLPAEIERHHPVGNVHHQAHVVLDQQHREPEPVANLLDQGAERPDFLVIEAARRLIEQQQLGLAGQGARQLHAFLRAEGQVGDARARHRLQAEEAHQRLRFSQCGALLVLHRRQAQGIEEEAAVRAAMAPDHDVVQHRHGLEQGEVLEGAPDAERGDAVPGDPQERCAVEQDVAAATLVEARQAVEQRGLAGAVGPDQADDASGLDVEGDAIQRDDAAKAHAHAVHAQQRPCSNRFDRSSSKGFVP